MLLFCRVGEDFNTEFSFLTRYKEGHAIQHWKDTQHCYSLDFKTQQIWDYVGDSYVHRLNQNQSKTDGKLEEMNFRCMSLEGDCDACECREDLGINGALFNSKVETVCFSSSCVSVCLLFMNIKFSYIFSQLMLLHTKRRKSIQYFLFFRDIKCVYFCI